MARERKSKGSSRRRAKPTGSVSAADKESRLWEEIKEKAKDTEARVATPLWNPAQFQHEESSIRSTHTPQDNAQSDRPPPATAAPSTPSSSRMSIPNLMNPTSPMEEPEVRPALFTPINSRTKRSTPKVAPAWSPMETPSARDRPLKLPTDAAQFVHQGGSLPQSDFHIDMNEFHTPQIERHGKLHFDNIESLKIDKEDGRVYHMGHVVRKPIELAKRLTDERQVGEGYSGIFMNDRPDSIPLQAQRKIKQMKEEKEKPLRIAQCAELLRYCRRLLDAGALLVLQRTSFVDFGEPVPCCRPFCPSESAIPEDSYYLSLEWTDCLYTFCLPCFEMLWDGKFTEHIYLGPPALSHTEWRDFAERRDSGVDLAMSTDRSAPPYSPLTPPRGTYQDPLEDMRILPRKVRHEESLSPSNEIFQSKHATPDEDIPPTPKASSHEPGPDIDSSSDSPGSCISTGEWRHPPTRFQHIASFIVSGGTLSGTDEAALLLWKETSRSQLEWERTLRKKKLIRDFYDGRSETDRSLEVGSLRVGKEWDEKYAGNAEALEEETGVRKKDCNGRELSEVLRSVVVKRKEQGGGSD